MDWKDVGRSILSFAPAIGGALLGPPGAAMGAGVSALAKALGDDESNITPEKVLSKLRTEPEETARALTRADLEYERELTRRLDIVNRTMQAEAKSEHWPQYSWRPFCGFLWPVAVLGIYVLLPLAGKTVPEVPQWIWLGWASILGVSAWHRGREKRAQAGDVEGVLGSVIRAIRG